MPVYITLETYRLDNCPEYETVSYAWGGEDGDSTSCPPVYICSYWNVLFQTRNCSSLLRYLQPYRRICINQRNTAERDTEIAMMR
jgi:hypothetical protein